MKDKFNLRQFITEGKLLKEEEDKEKDKGFDFWFRGGVRAQKQLNKAIYLLSEKGIEFKRKGFTLQFPGIYDIEEMRELMFTNGITKYVIVENIKASEILDIDKREI